MSERTSPPSPAPAKGTWIAPQPMWGQLGQMDRRAWMAVGVIAAFGGVAGGVMGMALPWPAMVPTLLMAAAAVSVGRIGWGWLRGRSDALADAWRERNPAADTGERAAEAVQAA
jgi:hypothetical protein